MTECRTTLADIGTAVGLLKAVSYNLYTDNKMEDDEYEEYVFVLDELYQKTKSEGNYP